MKTHNINTWAMDSMGWSREALPAACTVIKENTMTLEERIAALEARKKAHISAMERREASLPSARKAANPCKECGADYIYTNNFSAGLCRACADAERRGYIASYTKSVCIHPVCQDKREDGSLFCNLHRTHNRESNINDPCASCGVAERFITESYRVDAYCVDCGPMVRAPIVYKQKENLKFNKDLKK